MRPALRLAYWAIGRACSEEHREEIEGDLLELYARRIERRSRLGAEIWVAMAALRIALRRPSVAFVSTGLKLALVLTGTAVAIAYLLLAAKSSVLGWPFVMVGTTLELLFWTLLVVTLRRGARDAG